MTLNMKKIVFTLAIAIMAMSAFAQSRTANTQGGGTAKMAPSLDDYTAANEGWLVKLDEAFEESQATGKPIMANFTGSDWCGWCIRLEKAVFSKEEFKSWAEDNVVLLELDFPRRSAIPEEIRQQNGGLQQAFKVRGFPTVWVFNLEKNEESGKMAINAIGKTGYKATVDEFTGEVDRMLERASLAK